MTFNLALQILQSTYLIVYGMFIRVLSEINSKPTTIPSTLKMRLSLVAGILSERRAKLVNEARLGIMISWQVLSIWQLRTLLGQLSEPAKKYTKARIMVKWRGKERLVVKWIWMPSFITGNTRRLMAHQNQDLKQKLIHLRGQMPGLVYPLRNDARSQLSSIVR